jgi:hypothetical protein
MKKRLSQSNSTFSADLTLSVPASTNEAPFSWSLLVAGGAHSHFCAASFGT